MLSRTQLTDTQEAVVQHGPGPAAVLAVPGAGKTTALVHRVRHLVVDRGVPPRRILACSFNRATVQDLQAGLRELSIDGVETQTLHALGRSLLPDDLVSSAPDPAAAGRRLARRARRDLAAERDQAPEALGIPARALQDQVAAWKQQLAYPPSQTEELGPDAQSHAQTAAHENEDYLALYRRFEAHRHREGWLTYPDMVRDAWERLLYDDARRAHAQEAYRFVLVDEFQDVSRAQFHLLTLLTNSHQNLMAVGDDDQCIYEWRGANPDFLRRVGQRDDAEEYRLTDSFRLPAAPLVLANRLIDHNEARRPKQLRLTQGFGREARLLRAEDHTAAANDIADRIDALQAANHPLDDVAVLVRTYGQTPPIERALIDRTLPYRIRGRPPFYRRDAVTTLLRYLYWALLERRRRTNGLGSSTAWARYADRFAHILKRPTRYVPHAHIDQMRRQVEAQKRSALDVLADHRTDLPDETASLVADFAETAEALVDRLDAPADDTLQWLIDAIDYESALRERSAFAEQGDARVRTVRALVRYAAPYESSPALLRAVRALAANQDSSRSEAGVVDLRSIHRAKGAEWPVVFVPGCVDGTLPLDTDADTAPTLSEERRLFYVALTRTSDRLFLSTTTADAPSPFLSEADTETQLQTCRRMRQALQADPPALSDEDLLHLCRGISSLNLKRYFQQWWSPASDTRDKLKPRLDALEKRIDTAQARQSDYETALQAHEAAKADLRADVRSRVDALRDQIGTAPFRATHEQPDEPFPNDAVLAFDWIEDETRVGLFWEHTHVGTFNPLDARMHDTHRLLSLPWSDLVGRVAGTERRGGLLLFRIDWTETTERLVQARLDALDGPDPPSPLIRSLTDSAVRAGCEVLRDVL